MNLVILAIDKKSACVRAAREKPDLRYDPKYVDWIKQCTDKEIAGRQDHYEYNIPIWHLKGKRL